MKHRPAAGRAPRGRRLSDQTAKDRRRLVLGAAVGFRVAQVRVFVESLRATGYAGDVTMLVGPFQWRLRAYLARHGVRTLLHWSTRKLHGPIHAVRFERFAKILRRHAGRYDQVLVSDVRDVLFQKHPFAQVASAACRFYLEAGPWTIASEPTNRRWATLFLSPAEAERIGPCRFGCGARAAPTRPSTTRSRISPARSRPRSWRTTSTSPPWGSRRPRPMWPARTGSSGPPTGARPRSCINMTASRRSSARWKRNTGGLPRIRAAAAGRSGTLRNDAKPRKIAAKATFAAGKAGAIAFAPGDPPGRPRQIGNSDA